MTNIVSFGEVLFDVFPEKEIPGGAPMNVAYHLNQLGSKCHFISSVGNDELGNKLKDFLLSKGLQTDFIQTKSNYETGQVLVTINNEDVSYEIAFPAAWDFIDSDEHNVELVKNSDLLVFGSLACRNEKSFSTLKTLISNSKKNAFDINIRPPHYNWKTLEFLIEKSDILKINEVEIEMLKMHFKIKETEIEEVLKWLSLKFNIETILCTLGALGAVVLTNGKYYTCQIEPIKSVDPVGAGDSFFAAFMHFSHKGFDPQKSLELACKMGRTVAGMHGATPSISENQILANEN